MYLLRDCRCCPDLFRHFESPWMAQLVGLAGGLRTVDGPIPAAARITAATSFGRDSIATWLVGSAVMLAPIFFAIARWSSGWIIRSFSATMNHEGLIFQAAFVTFSSNAFPKIGPCVAAITFVCAAGRSGAKSRATPSGVR